MRAAIVVFPGTNREGDLAKAWAHISGKDAEFVWYQETQLPKSDIVFVPGGFSFGDYLRCGAIGARARIMGAIKDFAQCGGPVIGICNGFQLLCEAELLPGVLMRNADLRFVCQWQWLKVVATDSILTRACKIGQNLCVP
ncbi:MAG: phosphoribosylformylglycinamidine synthase subunit PurQ, partial [Pseudomonadota bacterium]